MFRPCPQVKAKQGVVPTPVLLRYSTLLSNACNLVEDANGKMTSGLHSLFTMIKAGVTFASATQRMIDSGADAEARARKDASDFKRLHSHISH